MDPKCHGSATLLYTGSLFSGELVGVVGAVGTGKSSVLAALLGELEKTGGRIALDRPPQGTRAAPQVLVFSFRKMWAASGSQFRSESRQAEIARQNKKISCQYSGLNDLQVLFGLHPTAFHVCSCISCMFI
jgi:ATPase subunit of ABC transporter with duplicated ATPase domains